MSVFRTIRMLISVGAFQIWAWALGDCRFRRALVAAACKYFESKAVRNADDPDDYSFGLLGRGA